ncbi:MAG: hypothetical protein K2N12_07855, partial [Helicobacter sp.]|nr:hypothetical protein [Helicobacter sp.]
AKLKSIEQSTTGKEIATLEAKEKELSGKIAKLIKEMSAQPNNATKEEIETLENGAIIYKDKNGKEHTISKEIQEEWISTFGLKNIEDSIEIALPDVVGEKIGKNIRINVGSLLKMVAQKREKYIGELAKVLEKPELVLGDDTILILARHLKDKDFFVNVSVDKGEYFVSISNGIKEANNLRNKIQNGMEILYQSPNANSNLQTLLQASRYSANKTDKGNSTPPNIKNGLENAETHESLQQQLQQVERELATNRERLDKAMPEDKPKLREIHRELLDKKKQIRAELGDKANTTQDATKTLAQQIQDTFKFSPQKARDLVQWHKESHPITKDEQGLPKVFYRLVQENFHTGRKVEFDVFSRQTSMKDIPNDIQDSAYGIAFYTNREDIKPAHRNQSKLYEVFLRIKKPLDLDTIITKQNMAEFEQLFKRNNEPKHLKANIAEFENKPLIEYLIQKGFDQYPYSLMRKNEKGIHGQLDFNNLADFLSLKGYDSATKTIVGEGKIIYMFNPNQIKSIENKGKFDSSNNIYQSNLHAGSGILTGSIAGLETDEQGNISFSPEKFVLGFLAGAAGSKAISSALQHLANNPEHKKQTIDVIAQSLAKNVPDTLKKYPLLELVLPRKIST